VRTPCLFCGGDASEPDHWQRCDGRQGALEAHEPEELEPVLQARAGDPETSHAAMAAYDVERLKTAADLVVRLHRAHGPLADFELKRLFDVAFDGPCCDHLYRQARSAARDRGQIRDSGARTVNPETNRRQVLWEYCDEAPLTIRRCGECGHVLRSGKPQVAAVED
jgi:hypothetical protein